MDKAAEEMVMDEAAEEMVMDKAAEEMVMDEAAEEMAMDEAAEEMVMDEAAWTKLQHLIPLRITTGVTKDMSSFEPVDFFIELIPKELLAYIVKETNRFGQQYMVSHAAYLAQHPKAKAK